MAQKKKGGFFSSLTNAVNDIAGDVDRGIKSVTTDIANSTITPLGYFTPGNVVMLSSRMAINKCLSVDSKGNLSCHVPVRAIHNASAQFQIIPSTFGANAYKLQCMAYPDCYLAIINGFLVGNGKGGPECDFYGVIAPVTSSVEIAEYMALQSAMFPNSYVGVLKTGQITNPAQTSPTASHSAHFKLKFVKSVQLPTPTAQQQPPPQQMPTQQMGNPSAPPPNQMQTQQPGYPSAPPPNQMQYPAATAPPPYAAYPSANQQPSPGMEKKPL